jgi:nicotinamide mononucleotide adenylyltransferase
MLDYRCYFMNGGHIAALKTIQATTDDLAIAIGRAAYRDKKADYSGFEIWDRDRMVHRCVARGPITSPD